MQFKSFNVLITNCYTSFALIFRLCTHSIKKNKFFFHKKSRSNLTWDMFLEKKQEKKNQQIMIFFYLENSDWMISLNSTATNLKNEIISVVTIKTKKKRFGQKHSSLYCEIERSKSVREFLYVYSPLQFHFVAYKSAVSLLLPW